MVSPFNIPAGNVLLAHRSAGGRFEASGARTVTFGEQSGLIDESVTGRVRGAGASGTYRATVELSDNAGASLGKCETGTVRWQAKSSPGRIYAGVTSAGQAAVITLDSKRRRVQQMQIGSFLNCGAAGGMPYGDTFAAPLRPDGRFTDTDDYTAGGDRGHDHVHGRIRGGRARGVFHNRVETTIDGAKVTCRTGRVTWRARTSPTRR
jgi:hypothetical protein